ncbi:MAG: AAA family ATPase [Pseudomonadota bacterium]
MLFSAIRLRNVRQFGPDGLAIEGLSPGLNVLTKPNEFGKSTILRAVQDALFLKASSKKASDLVPFGTDEAPYVELELELAGTPFRIRKCFAFGKKATLHRIETLAGVEIARDGEAQQWVTANIGASSVGEGLPGLLWMGQGDALTTVLTPAHTETAQGMLSDAVTEVAGGDAARDVADAAAAALREIEDGNRRPKGQLKDALAQIEQQTAAISEAEAALRRTAALREQVRSLRRRVTSLTDPAEDARLTADIEKARLEAEKASKAEADLGHTEADLARSRDDLSRAEKVLFAFEGDANSLKERVKKQSMAEANRLQLDEALGHTDAQLRDSAERAVKAEQRHRQAELVLRQASAHARRALETQRREDLQKQLKAAEALQAEIVALKPIADRERLDLKTLALLERSAIEADAALSAQAPILSVETGGPVDLDGLTLNAGDTAPIIRAGRVVVGETVLSISQAGSDQAQSKARDTKRALQEALVKTGCATIDDARHFEGETKSANAATAAKREELARMAPDGLNALAEELAGLQTDGDDLEAPQQTLPEAEAALAEAEIQVRERRAAAAVLEEELAKLTKQLADLQITMAVDQADIDRLSVELGTESEQAKRRTELEADVENARAAQGTIFLRMEALQREVEAGTLLKDRHARLVENQKQRQRDRTRDGEKLARDEATLNAQLGQGAAENLDAARGKCAAAERTRDKLEAKRRALKLLIQTIGEEQAERQERFLAPVRRESMPMLRHVYGEAALHFDSKLNPETLERPSGSFESKALSAGTQEQIALLTRLGFAKLSASQGSPAPLILDDVLVYADDDRVERIFDVIREVAKVTQVIVLSCRERLFERLGGQPIEPKPFPLRD